MKTTLKTMIAAATIVAASAVAAGAATLNLLGPTQSQVIANNDLVGLGLNGQTIQFITGADKGASNGLEIVGAGPFKITYTYLGKEAGNTNHSIYAGNQVLFLGTDARGSVKTADQAMAGLIDFGFVTTAPNSALGTILNNGAANPNSANYAIGYFKLSDTSYLALFDDIASGDRDFDDHGIRIDVTAVPLPAGGLLLLTALGGIAAMRRRKAA